MLFIAIEIPEYSEAPFDETTKFEETVEDEKEKTALPDPNLSENYSAIHKDCYTCILEYLKPVYGNEKKCSVCLWKTKKSFQKVLAHADDFPPDYSSTDPLLLWIKTKKKSTELD